MFLTQRKSVQRSFICNTVRFYKERVLKDILEKCQLQVKFHLPISLVPPVTGWLTNMS